MAERRGSPWRTREEGSLLLASVLWTVDRLRWLLKGLGVDYPIFRELLRTRIVLSLRPSSSSDSGWGTTGIVLSILLTWLTGLGTGLIALLSPNASLWIVGSQSLLLILLGMLLLLQIANVLVDPTDIGVVAPHPVPDRTLFAVRLAQVLAYVLIFALSFTAGNVLLAVFKKPLLPVLFVYPLISLLCALTTLGAVALLFAACLRIVGPVYFQRVTLWVQILGAALLMGGYQIGPRLVPHEAWSRLFETHSGFLLLWPPFQYAGLFDLACGEWSRSNLLASGIAFVVPALALLVTLVLASRYFIAGLEGTLGFGSSPRARWSRGFVSRLGAWLTGSREERAGYDFALALSRREPHVLRGVLPQLVSFQLMAVAIGLGTGRHTGDIGLFIPMSAGLLALVLPTLLELTQATPEPEARWIFVAAPLEHEGAILRGGVKALLAAWFGAAALVNLGLQLLIVGPGELPRIVLALELAAAMTLFFARRFELGIPFSRTIRTGQTGVRNFGLILLMWFGMVILFGIHALLSLHPIALWSGIVACAALLVWLWRALDSLPIAPERRLRPTRATVET